MDLNNIAEDIMNPSSMMWTNVVGVSQPIHAQETQSTAAAGTAASQVPSVDTGAGTLTSQKPYIRIIEQPQNKGLRFRYECEGRSAGSIPGEHSTPENKTYPTVEIVGYDGDVDLVVSCVTKDRPYRPHPHKLVGREGCKDGICHMKLTSGSLRAVISHVGIQCARRRDIRAALEERERRKIDPFNTKYAHKDQPSSIDLNVVRLCFQALIRTNQGRKALQPVVSNPIYEKKANNDLIICRLCSCSARINGGDEIIMLCEKVTKEDIKIKFYELNHEGDEIWQAYADFQHSDVHKQTAIAFKTPRYHSAEVKPNARVYLQLIRPSDGTTSEPIPFQYYSDPDELKRKRTKPGSQYFPGSILWQELQSSEQKVKNSTIFNDFQGPSSSPNHLKPPNAPHYGSSNSPNLMAEIKTETVYSVRDSRSNSSSPFPDVFTPSPAAPTLVDQMQPQYIQQTSTVTLLPTLNSMNNLSSSCMSVPTNTSSNINNNLDLCNSSYQSLGQNNWPTTPGYNLPPEQYINQSFVNTATIFQQQLQQQKQQQQQQQQQPQQLQQMPYENISDILPNNNDALTSSGLIELLTNESQLLFANLSNLSIHDDDNAQKKPNILGTVTP